MGDPGVSVHSALHQGPDANSLPSSQSFNHNKKAIYHQVKTGPKRIKNGFNYDNDLWNTVEIQQGKSQASALWYYPRDVLQLNPNKP